MGMKHVNGGPCSRGKQMLRGL